MEGKYSSCVSALSLKVYQGRLEPSPLPTTCVSPRRVYANMLFCVCRRFAALPPAGSGRNRGSVGFRSLPRGAQPSAPGQGHEPISQVSATGVLSASPFGMQAQRDRLPGPAVSRGACLFPPFKSSGLAVIPEMGSSKCWWGCGETGALAHRQSKVLWLLWPRAWWLLRWGTQHYQRAVRG